MSNTTRGLTELRDTLLGLESKMKTAQYSLDKVHDFDAGDGRFSRVYSELGHVFNMLDARIKRLKAEEKEREYFVADRVVKYQGKRLKWVSWLEDRSLSTGWAWLLDPNDDDADAYAIVEIIGSCKVRWILYEPAQPCGVKADDGIMEDWEESIDHVNKQLAKLDKGGV